MNDKILRELRALKVYSLILTISLIAVIVMSFTGGTQKQIFAKEILQTRHFNYYII